MPDRYLVEIPWGNAQAVGIELDAVLLRSKLMHKSEEPVAEGNRPVFTAFPRPAPYIQSPPHPEKEPVQEIVLFLHPEVITAESTGEQHPCHVHP